MKFDPELLKEAGRISAEYAKVYNDLETVWAAKIVFTWHWWLAAALAALPWILWLIIRDRKKQHSLLYAGMFTMIIALLLDMAGVSQQGWHYNSKLLPYFTQFLPWDVTVMPVTAMLFYQFFPRISPWLKGVLFGMTAAYVVEPVFIWLGIYEPHNWEHHYSLPIYFVIYMIGYWLYSRSFREADKRNIV
jgi:hypothetical protein